MKKEFQQQNIKYLKYRLNQLIFVNKVLFSLTVMLEAFLFLFGWYRFKNTSADQTDFIIVLIAYFIFAFPFIVSFVTMALTKAELSACTRYVSAELEESEHEEIEEIVNKARDINFSELSVLIIAFVFYALSVF